MAVDPYGPDIPDFVVGEKFIDIWCSMLALCQKRFEGKSSSTSDGELRRHRLLHARQLPGLRRFRDNVYVIADSNHGYKMIGVGKLVAQRDLRREHALLEPFRFSRLPRASSIRCPTARSLELMVSVRRQHLAG